MIIFSENEDNCIKLVNYLTSTLTDIEDFIEFVELETVRDSPLWPEGVPVFFQKENEPIYGNEIIPAVMQYVEGGGDVVKLPNGQIISKEEFANPVGDEYNNSWFKPDLEEQRNVVPDRRDLYRTVENDLNRNNRIPDNVDNEIMPNFKKKSRRKGF